MTMQGDGNMVLYRPGYTAAVWSTRTNGRCGYWTTTIGLQTDSNFVIYCRLFTDADGWQMYPIWSTGTVIH
ncbi:hypothetical protein WEI85_05205 [Actinomycetes bacterium KLBMP 9797]